MIEIGDPSGYIKEVDFYNEFQSELILPHSKRISWHINRTGVYFCKSDRYYCIMDFSRKRQREDEPEASKRQREEPATSNDQTNTEIDSADVALENITDHIHIEEAGSKIWKKFGLHSKCFSVKAFDLETLPFAIVPMALTLILQHVLDYVLEGVRPEEMVRVRIDSKSLNYPIWTPPIQRSQLTVRRWMAEVARVLNSYEEFSMDKHFEVLVQHTDIPRGSCVRDVPIILKKRLQRMKSVILITNADSICLARALVVGMAYADGDKQKCRRIRRGEKLQSKEAKALIKNAGLDEREYTIADVPFFQQALAEYQIIIVSVDHANSIVYSGPKQSKRIVLLHHDHHFDLLNSLPAFFQRNYWCYACNKGYNEKADHRCESICHSCLRNDCEADKGNVIECQDCHRKFFGSGCFTEHKVASTPTQKQRKSICQSVFKCQQCFRVVSNRNRKGVSQHQCGEVYCQTCKTHELPDSHKCFIKPHKVTEEDLEEHRNASFLYFDLETYVSENRELVPNLAVVQDDEGHEWIFPEEGTPFGGNVTDQLCSFLFNERHRDHYIIAHNFKGFDGYFILRWLLENGIVPKVIMNGGKILQLDVSEFNICFRDSFNYNPQSLAKWPATFGIRDIGKGTFPHRFNRKENWDKVLPFPEPEEYGFSCMNRKAKESFMSWYATEAKEKDYLFDFRKEIEEYCRMDVTVLRMCCQQFRRLFQEISNGLCPFVSAMTIAGVCNRYWKSFILKPQQIGLLPQRLHAKNRNQSEIAKKWLAWIEKEEECALESALNGSEHQIGPFFVDGYRADINHVYEFYGCWYHGCPQCEAPGTIHPFRNIPMSEIYNETLEREKYIRSQGYGVTTIWEHEFADQIKSDPELRSFVQKLSFIAPLDPRDAFYGGRTNAVKLFHQISGDETISYYDVNSEYPYVNKNKRYPVGHPTIITKDFKDIGNYFGIALCQVLPPGDLKLPVLPYRSGGKLTFPLCRTCVDKYQNTKCEHTDEERALTGAWCTPEINEAVKRGYMVEKIHEVWHFEQYEDRLFEEYINKFLKIKTEASGWPAHVHTEDEKHQYIQDFKQHEKVELDYDKITPNAGLRSLSKLCLNSFWGRLGMQENKLSTAYITEPEKFYDMLLSGKYHVHSWDMFSEDVVQLTYTKESGFVDRNPNTNVILAAFTTCWARLHLYKFMDMVGDRLLYFDTDSIFFVTKPGLVDPPTGCFLGDLTNELKPGQHIVQFISLGAKTYAYVTNDGDTVVKVKGFTLNGQTSEQINFSKMLEMLENRDTVDIQYPDILKRVKKDLTICSASMKKRFQVTYDKRRIVDSEYNTLPYGFKLL
ncbi:uncharacterized protein LOC129592761 isoform X3 [Paramacrobiotus metropolitanus]|uniref:uncharacterized protein LOC129592761 isoform X3 n=1 Tax=Paramacrobiotus metropolitanus TaxID=2943436 RepID=UPI0024464AAC|nr:uncharacterized protein LOC129592761 isoform X3 [Paramacrobiotus metropolitanus]